LNTLLAADEISQATFDKRASEVKLWYDERIKEAGFGAAGIMRAIESAIAPRPRGRPPEKLLPDENDVRDWQVIMEAHSSVEFGEGKRPPLDQLFEAIPLAVERALSIGLLPARGDHNELHRAKSTHVERITRRARKIFEEKLN
jgi:hypothetical protein